MRWVVLVLLTRVCVARADPLQVGGYLEGYYAVQVQDASNRIIALRGFDDRSRAFALSNAVLVVDGEADVVTTHLVVQIGDTPSAYYANEPAWKYLQAASVRAKAPAGYVIEAGLFPSPIGPEVFAVKDNWNWSRSNLFYGLPFYHLGATVAHPLGGGWDAKLHVYNGWNDIADNNAYPSVGVSASYTGPHATGQILYFGGIEAPQGHAWRHLLDMFVQVPVSEVFTLQLHLDGGVEGNRSWAAAALYSKVQLGSRLYAAARGDVFRATLPIFWPVRWVAEATATLAYQPVAHASIRLEYRHDQAAAAAYYGGEVARDPVTGTYIANRDRQDTVTLGATASF